jgi:hypothetical protein
MPLTRLLPVLSPAAPYCTALLLRQKTLIIPENGPQAQFVRALDFTIHGTSIRNPLSHKDFMQPRLGIPNATTHHFVRVLDGVL